MIPYIKEIDPFQTKSLMVQDYFQEESFKKGNWGKLIRQASILSSFQNGSLQILHNQTKSKDNKRLSRPEIQKTKKLINLLDGKSSWTKIINRKINFINDLSKGAQVLRNIYCQFISLSRRSYALQVLPTLRQNLQD
jgi:hypothetical protein